MDRQGGRLPRLDVEADRALSRAVEGDEGELVVARRELEVGLGVTVLVSASSMMIRAGGSDATLRKPASDWPSDPRRLRRLRSRWGPEAPRQGCKSSRAFSCPLPLSPSTDARAGHSPAWPSRGDCRMRARRCNRSTCRAPAPRPPISVADFSRGPARRHLPAAFSRLTPARRPCPSFRRADLTTNSKRSRLLAPLAGGPTAPVAHLDRARLS